MAFRDFKTIVLSCYFLQKSIGMVDPKKVYRSSHALIGYKGKWPKMMTKFKSELTGKVEVRYTYGKLIAAFFVFQFVLSGLVRIYSY